MVFYVRRWHWSCWCWLLLITADCWWLLLVAAGCYCRCFLLLAAAGCCRIAAAWILVVEDCWSRLGYYLLIDCWRRSLWTYSGYWLFAAKTILQAKKSSNILAEMMRKFGWDKILKLSYNIFRAKDWIPELWWEESGREFRLGEIG